MKRSLIVVLLGIIMLVSLVPVEAIASALDETSENPEYPVETAVISEVEKQNAEPTSEVIPILEPAIEKSEPEESANEGAEALDIDPTATETPENKESISTDETDKLVQETKKEQPGRVVFSCDPETLVLFVFSLQELERAEREQTEPQPIEPEADNSYLLWPGEYVYSACSDGFETIEKQPFTIMNGEAGKTVYVTLKKLESEAQETEKVGEPVSIIERDSNGEEETFTDMPILANARENRMTLQSAAAAEGVTDDETHVPNATAEDLTALPAFAPNFNYDMWTVVEYTIEDIHADLVCTVSAKSDLSEFYLECNFYGDDQMTRTTYDGSEYTVLEDATGFMTGDTPAILDIAIAQNLWIPMSGYKISGITIDQPHFPDAVFREYITENCDKNRDGFLDDEEIAVVTSINVSGQGITSLNGIAYFTALMELDCSENGLTNLSMSANTALTYLNCGYNQLTGLDVSTNTALAKLLCGSNRLTNLNVCTNTALTELACYGNQLRSLDLRTNRNLTSLACFNNQLLSLDVSVNTALTELTCKGNQLKSLNLNSNTALQSVDCSGQSASAKLTKTDGTYQFDFSALVGSDNVDRVTVTAVTPADTQYSMENGILTTDTELTEITYTYAHGGPDNGTMDVALLLTTKQTPTAETGYTAEDLPVEPEFDPNPDYDMWTVVEYTIEDIQADLVCTVSATSDLSEFYMECNFYGDDQMTLTKVENGEYVNYVDATGFMAGDTPAILDIAIAQNLWVPMRGSVMPSEIAIDEVNFPDVNFRSYVAEHCDTDQNGSLSSGEVRAVTDMDVSSCGIADLTGIEYFTALTRLNCSWNLLTRLDVNANTALTYLHCDNNQLSHLDVTANTSLRELRCRSNRLTSLDVRKNKKLIFLACDMNQLNSLDVHTNTELTELQCVNNFITSLDVNTNKSLEVLFCDQNQLTSLDLSENTALKYLECGENQLTSLNVRGCTALITLACSFNHLTSLDLRDNTSMGWLYCSDNQLKNIDLSANAALRELHCEHNRLTYLDLSTNPNLQDNAYFSASGQTASAEMLWTDVAYRLDFSTLVGTENVGRVTVLSVTPADAHYSVKDGVLTTEVALTALTYTYAHSGPDNGTMDVTLALTTSHTTTEPIEKHTHESDEGTVTKAATCEEAGEKTYKCKNCGEVLKTEKIPALGHDWDEGTVTKPATCTEKGEKTVTCKNDSTHTQVEEIPMIPHSWGTWTVTVKAENGKAGSRSHTCSVCNTTETESFTITTLEGAGGKYIKTSGKTLTFRFSEELALFEDIYVDGNKVDARNYSKASGSTVITLHNLFLSQLAAGNHTITAVFSSGNVTTTFSTASPSSTPSTGDNSHIGLWIGLLAVAAVGAGAVSVMARKKARAK